MKRAIAVFAVLIAITFAVAAFAADPPKITNSCPRPTGHVNDLRQALRESVVENLENALKNISGSYHVNFVVVVMSPPPEVIADARAEPCVYKFPTSWDRSACSPVAQPNPSGEDIYAKKVLATWNRYEEGEKLTDRGTVFYLVFTDGTLPQIAASESLRPLITPELKKKMWSAVEWSMGQGDIRGAVVDGLNALFPTFLDTPLNPSQVQAKR